MYYYIISIDYGYKNIGLAITQNITYISKPLKTIKIKNHNWNEVLITINKWKPKIIIIGLNKNNKSFYKNLKKFYKFIKINTKAILYFQDESFTSYDAYYKIKHQNINIHAYSAKIILDDWILNNKYKKAYNEKH